METHYVCKGRCGGVSDEPHATCQTTGCSQHAEHMAPCNCSDEKHEEVHENTQEEESKEDQ